MNKLSGFLEQVMIIYEMGPLRALFLVDGSTDHKIYYIIDPKVFDLENTVWCQNSC